MQRLPAFLTVQHSTENRDESIRITTALLTGTALVHAGEMKGMEMKGEMKGSRARQEHELACDDNLQEDLIMDIQGTNMNIPMKRWSISTSAHVVKLLGYEQSIGYLRIAPHGKPD